MDLKQNEFVAGHVLGRYAEHEKQEATQSLYSGRICGSEGTIRGNELKALQFLAKSTLSAFHC